MARSRDALGGASADDIDAVLFNPAQLAAVDTVADLITELRAAATPAELFAFQQELFRHVYEAQEAWAGASRNAKRLRRGRPVPDAPSADWETELRVWSRICRQLLSVGDALAWRAFGFDRRYLIVLASNASAGPMVGKEGLGYELGAILETWKREGRFALLHDLTSSLRIADITLFTSEGPRLLEVKASTRRIDRGQRHRMQAAVDAINEGASLPGSNETGVFVSSQQFKTHLRRLGDVLGLAMRDGIAALPVSQGWVASALSIGAPKAPTDAVTGIKIIDEKNRRVATRANLEQATHQLTSVSTDRAGSHPAVAPFSIFPFDPDVCARLTCDVLAYRTSMDWDVLASAFREQGFDVSNPLPPSTGDISNHQPSLTARRGRNVVRLNGFGVSQILGEFIDPRRFATAALEFADQHHWSGGVLTFSNERATWR